jgi:hypothetical protein
MYDVGATLAVALPSANNEQRTTNKMNKMNTYDYERCSHSGRGKACLAPRSEWEEVFTAARAAHGGSYGDNVLRHPDFVIGDAGGHANEWGMNMLANGAFNYGGSCSTHLKWDNGHIYYAYWWSGQDSQPGCGQLIRYNYWDGEVAVQTGQWNGVNVRAIYTGDGE